MAEAKPPKQPETEPVVETPPAAEPKTEAKPVRMTAVHGLMVHPFDATVFGHGDEVKHVVDSWCQIQIDAGKLALVKD